jgi:hypothetical protein
MDESCLVSSLATAGMPRYRLAITTLLPVRAMAR